MTLELEQLNLENVKGFCFILGATKSGKTRLITKLSKHCETVLAYSADIEYPIPKFSDLSSLESMPQFPLQSPLRPQLQCLIIDDMIHEPDGIMDSFPKTMINRFEDSALAKKLILQTRRVASIVLFASHYFIFQRLASRVNMDYIFILPNGIKANNAAIHAIHRYYIDWLDTPIIRAILDALNNDQVLVVNTVSQSLYWYELD